MILTHKHAAEVCEALYEAGIDADDDPAAGVREFARQRDEARQVLADIEQQLTEEGEGR